MRKFNSWLSFLLAVIMVVGTFASCAGNIGDQETQVSTDEHTSDSSNATESDDSEAVESGDSETTQPGGSETTQPGGSETTQPSGSDESESETTEGPKYQGTNEELISNAQNLAGKVNSYFDNADRNHFVMENGSAVLKYSLMSENFQGFASISNKNGVDYIRDTMVAFVTKKDGSTYYSSNSFADTQANINRFGYYYYENRLECEALVSPAEAETKLNLGKFNNPMDLSNEYADGVLSLKIQAIGDPRIYCKVNAKDRNFLKITMKADLSDASRNTVQVFFTYGSSDAYDSSIVVNLNLATDGEYHTYYVPLSSLPEFDGKVYSMRLDLNGSLGDRYDISEISFEERKFDDIYLARAVHMYSDKMHQTLQFSSKKEVTSISEFGMITKIAKDTVAKVIVKDKSGIHESFEGISWTSAEYVGFDIVGAGIFGYILPDDRLSGKIIVTEEDGMYVIKQYRPAQGGKISPSPAGTANENDVYMGHRIYTDDSHDFAKFLKEAYCERNPLKGNRVTVHKEYSEEGEFLGYDPLRGVYILNVKSVNFLGAFLTYPNRHFGVNFTVTGDDVDRSIYIMTYSDANGTIESGVVLNDKNMLLPIPVEVAKNFPGDGEANMFNVDDLRYSEAIIPFIAGAETKQEITILNLYQKWGKYDLKQISSIQFYCPFYHFSTGTTETNCIRHMYDTKEERALMYLPDHRAWSAPYWHEMGIGNSQPQHTNGGNHYFLQYTDADGSYNATEFVSDTIISSGPTYAELKMDYITDDRKMQVSHTHMEMPQNDENRTYYTIEYKVLEDVSIKDFRQNFSIYSVSEKTTGGYYRYIGYLDKENKYAYADSLAQTDAVADGTQVVYELGNIAPYFSFFYVPDYTNYEIPGYVNVSFIIANTEITINGQKYEPKFLLYNEKIDGKVYLRLTLDLGDITLSAGDTFTMNAIITPWGSQELNHQKYDATSNQLVDIEPVDGKLYYNTVIGTDANGDPIYYMDKNVRDIRENSVLRPFAGTAVKDCEVVKSAFMPIFRTTNGKSAEFTISGGENNVSTRIYGFNTLTVPKIEEFVNGEWVEYEVCSINTPDGKGYGHLYDGYMVHYDADGTYSYSFVTTMKGGAARTFRITVDGEFEGFPDELVVKQDGYYENEDYKFYWTPDILDELALGTLDKLGNVSVEKDYISFYGNPDRKEGYIIPISSGDKSAGRYIAIKYRFPNSNKNIAPNKIEIFASMIHEGTAVTAEEGFYAPVTADGKWHILVVDLAATKPGSFTADQNGNYYIKGLRLDILNQITPATDCIDIAYVATFTEYDKAISFDKEVDYVTYKAGNSELNLDPTTGEEYVIKYNKNENYHDSTVAHGSCLEGLNGKKLVNGLGGSTIKGPEIISLNSHTVGNSLVYISGWTVVEGGFSKIVWSADGGKTWNDVSFYNRSGYDNGGIDHITVAEGRLNNTYTFVDKAASYTGIRYSGTRYSYYSEAGAGIAADLTAYIGQTVDVTFAAIPKSDPQGLCYITHVLNVEVVAPGTPDEDVVNDTYNDLSSGYVKSQIAHATCLEGVNGKKLAGGLGGSSIKGPEIIALNSSTVGDSLVYISGWTVVEGGFSKIVWSADGGKTWNDVSFYNRSGYDNGGNDHITVAQGRLNNTYTFVDKAASYTGARYQSPTGSLIDSYNTTGAGVAADLSAYAGQTVNVTFAAVPKGQPNSLCYIAHITGVQVPDAN